MALAATLDVDLGESAHLPPGWHWILFNPVVPGNGLAEDGHPHRGEFLPPVDLPRRMWAGGAFRVHRPLRLGDAVRRESEIIDIQDKQGRSGALVFVTVRHLLSGPEGLALEETQEVVYREAARPGAAPDTKTAPERAEWRKQIRPDPVLLFRYSALTFNSHRIHYDQPYATRVEGYAGLVVHAPLMATLMLELLRAQLPGRELQSFSFRALTALFCPDPFEALGAPDPSGDEIELWVRGPANVLAMSARATLRAGKP